MDREAPKRRPPGPRAAFHRWKKLCFIHWEVPTELIRPLVHPRLSVDSFEGRTFLGLVPFTMEDIQLRHLPKWPGMTHFHETNVRVYVTLDGENPGVWFLSLDAASRLCVLGARLTYHLPYYFADMSLEESGPTIAYRSKRLWPEPTPAEIDVQWTVADDLHHAEPGSLEDFLCERYFLYSEKGGRLFRGQVHHTPYPIVSARLDHLRETLTDSAGLAVSGPPLSVLASPGVDVDVFSIVEV